MWGGTGCIELDRLKILRFSKVSLGPSRIKVSYRGSSQDLDTWLITMVIVLVPQVEDPKRWREIESLKRETLQHVHAILSLKRGTQR